MKVIQRIQGSDQPTILRGLSDGTVLLNGTHKRVLLQDCVNLRIESESEALTVSGDGNGLQWPLVMCAGSRDIELGPIHLEPKTDESSKEAWIKTVPNGFEARPDCSNISVDFIRGERLHYPVLGRCPGFRLDGAWLRYVSGDFVRVNGDNFQIHDVTGLYSLDVFGYQRVHRDAVQGWQEDKARTSEHGLPMLSGGLIKGCKFWMPDYGHKWAKSGDGYLFTEGESENINFEDNQLYTNNANGIRGLIHRSELTPDNIFERADGEVPEWANQ